jgi:hypothetical protein
MSQDGFQYDFILQMVIQFTDAVETHNVLVCKKAWILSLPQYCGPKMCWGGNSYVPIKMMPFIKKQFNPMPFQQIRFQKWNM